MISLAEELQDIDLGDQRLNRRARRLLEKLGSNPSASIPVACGGYREIKAAYRLLSNEKVDAQKILEPHYANTGERMRKQSIVLCIQDTTELDLGCPKTASTVQIYCPGSGPRQQIPHCPPFNILGH
ncbi:MAG: hypothetical protein HQL87_08980 [Magnetococcales bacterium]|nr:hypothetical protein [Magnetococcales bacterium]